MEFVQLGNNVAGTSEDKISLSSSEFLQLLGDIAWSLNPLTWLDFIWEPFYGYDVEDYIIENPNDEDHYYKNWN